MKQTMNRAEKIAYLQEHGVSHVPIPYAADLLCLCRQSVAYRINHGTLATVDLDKQKLIPLTDILREIKCSNTCKT